MEFRGGEVATPPFTNLAPLDVSSMERLAQNALHAGQLAQMALAGEHLTPPCVTSLTPSLKGDPTPCATLPANLNPYSLATTAMFALLMSTHRISLLAVVAIMCFIAALYFFDAAPPLILGAGAWTYRAALTTGASLVHSAASVPYVGKYLGLAMWAILWPFMMLVQKMGGLFSGIGGGLIGTLMMLWFFGPFGILLALMVQLHLFQKIGPSTAMGGIPFVSDLVRNFPAMGTLSQRAPAPRKKGCNGSEEPRLGEPLWRGSG